MDYLKRQKKNAKYQLYAVECPGIRSTQHPRGMIQVTIVPLERTITRVRFTIPPLGNTDELTSLNSVRTEIKYLQLRPSAKRLWPLFVPLDAIS